MKKVPSISITKHKEKEKKARYYAGIHGNRGAATRLGTPNSGMTCFLNGWHIGLDTYAGPWYVNTNKDSISLTMTGGSGHKGKNRNLGDIVETDDGPVFEPSQYVIDLCKGLDPAKET